MPDAGPDPLPVIPIDNQGLFTAAPLTPEPATPQRKGRPLIAWIVIGICVAFLVVPHLLSDTADGAGTDSTVTVKTLKFQGKIIVGTHDFFGNAANLDSQISLLNTGPVDQRLRFVVLSGEVGGPKQALENLQELKKRLQNNNKQPTDKQAAVSRILEKLYADYARNELKAPTVSEEERALLHRELDWFGDLALAPKDGPNQPLREGVIGSARRALIAYWIAFIGGGLLALIGLAGLIVFVILLFMGKIKHGIHTGSLHGPVYAETFALWLAVFIGFAYLRQFLDKQRMVPTGLPGYLTMLVGECLTLGVLVWPVLRGIPWSQVRWEMGLRLGRRPLLEPLCGIAGNVMALPLVILGATTTVLLIMLRNRLHNAGSLLDNFSGPDLPSHPIVNELPGATWVQYLQLFIIASVLAPIVEETMFRGALYRHLREATARLGYGWSVLLSAFVSSYVFAAIHPQGLLGIPPLMALAFTFCLLREWRGTLVPGIVAHGINNGVVLLLGINILGG